MGLITHLHWARSMVLAVYPEEFRVSHQYVITRFSFEITYRNSKFYRLNFAEIAKSLFRCFQLEKIYTSPEVVLYCEEVEGWYCF